MSQVRASTQINNDSHLIEADGSQALTSNWDAGAQKITNLKAVEINNDPTSDNEVARKGYVDGVAEGLTVKDAVRVQAQSNISIGSEVGTAKGSASRNNPTNSQVDSVWVNRKDRVLLSSQSTGSENGIYKVGDTSTALRSEFDLSSTDNQMDIRVELSSSNDIHVEVKISDPGSSTGSTSVTEVTTGDQTTPYQLRVDLEHNGTSVLASVDDVVSALDGHSTVNASIINSSSGESVDRFGGGEDTGWVNMGVYNNGSGWVRTQDWDTDSDVTTGAFTFVEEGTDSNKGFVMTSDNVNVGSDTPSFTQFSGAGQITAGDGMTKSGDKLNVNAADNSMTINADNLQVQKENTLAVDPGNNTGLGLSPMSGGNIYVGQDTSSAVTAQSPSNDVSMDASGNFTVQTSGNNSLISTNNPGIQIAQISSGNLIIGQGGSSDPASVQLGNEAQSLDASGNFTLNWAREDLSSQTDGSTTTFSLDGTTFGQAVAAKEMVYLNGVLQQPDGDQNTSTISNDYVLDTSNNDVVFSSAPASSDELIVHYIYT